MKPEAKPIEKNFSVSTPKLSQAEFLEILREARADIVASGIPLLTWEQLDCELAERRGREDDDDIIVH